MEKTVAIVLAAGQGKRMNSKIHKQYMLLCGKPVLFYALDTFEKSFIDEIIIVVGKDEISYCQNEIVEKYHFNKVKHIIEGGKERYHSVYNGLECIEQADYVFIHDGARPFITQDILNRALNSVRENKACVVGMPVKDTIKIADSDCFVESTPQRSSVWMVQTPQVFECNLIKKSYEKLIRQENELLKSGISITDDAMVVEHFENVPVKLVQGSYENIKITTPEDIKIAQTLVGV